MELFLLEANKHISNFIFPNYSAKLFISDLQEYPVSKEACFQVLKQYPNISYLDFFKLTRKIPRPGSEVLENANTELIREIEFKIEIWNIFSKGSLMLYFEPLFLKLISPRYKLHPKADVLLYYLRQLSSKLITEWDKIVCNLGCCCYEFFCLEPELYLDLIVVRDRMLQLPILTTRSDSPSEEQKVRKDSSEQLDYTKPDGSVEGSNFCEQAIPNMNKASQGVVDGMIKNEHPINLTDQEILRKLNYPTPLSQKAYHGKISRKSSRSELIKFYLDLESKSPTSTLLMN